MPLTSHIPPLSEVWDEIEFEDLPAYAPSTVPFYHVLASDEAASIYVFRQPTKRQRLVTLAPECLGEDNLPGHKYVLTAKRRPSMFRVVTKSADMELTRVNLIDPEFPGKETPERSASVGGQYQAQNSRRFSSSSLALSQSRRPNAAIHFGRRISFQPFQPSSSTLTITHTVPLPRQITLNSNSSTASVNQTPPLSRSSSAPSTLSSTSLIASLYTRPQLSSVPWHPHLHFTYVRNPLQPVYVTLHAPKLLNFRLEISSTPSYLPLPATVAATHKYYAWKLTTYPTIAHSLLDRRGTCVARFVYGTKGTYASKKEEIGRLEIYDPKLPQLEYSSENGETVEDWTEVIIVSCDLVVQYWRNLGRRYKRKPGNVMSPRAEMQWAREVSLTENREDDRFGLENVPREGYCVA